MKRTIRKPYDAPQRLQIFFLDEDGNPAIGRCKQSHKAECDINNILRNYDRTGLITHVNRSTAEYGDYSEVNEFQDSLNMVISATDSFMELPSEIRKKFGNDPGNFFEFATDPKNAAEMVELGLAYKIEEEQPIKVEIKNPPKAAE